MGWHRPPGPKGHDVVADTTAWIFVLVSDLTPPIKLPYLNNGNPSHIRDHACGPTFGRSDIFMSGLPKDRKYAYGLNYMLSEESIILNEILNTTKPNTNIRSTG